jgi:hypothetical protein
MSIKSTDMPSIDTPIIEYDRDLSDLRPLPHAKDLKPTSTPLTTASSDLLIERASPHLLEKRRHTTAELNNIRTLPIQRNKYLTSPFLESFDFLSSSQKIDPLNAKTLHSFLSFLQIDYPTSPLEFLALIASVSSQKDLLSTFLYNPLILVINDRSTHNLSILIQLLISFLKTSRIQAYINLPTKESLNALLLTRIAVTFLVDAVSFESLHAHFEGDVNATLVTRRRSSVFDTAPKEIHIDLLVQTGISMLYIFIRKISVLKLSSYLMSLFKRLYSPPQSII